MLEGYCATCKDKKPLHDALEVVMTSGRKAFKGRCPTCGGGMFKILGEKSPGGGFSDPETAAEEAVLAEAIPAAAEPLSAPLPVSTELFDSSGSGAPR